MKVETIIGSMSGELEIGTESNPINSNVQAKITYTVDSYSFKNIGLGISTKLGAFNSYLLVDNLLNFSNLYSARSASVQAGINFIFNDKN